MKKFFIILGIIIFLPIVCVILAAMFFDINSYKPEVEKMVAKYAKVDANYGGSALELVISTVSAQIAQGILNVNNPDFDLVDRI